MAADRRTHQLREELALVSSLIICCLASASASAQSTDMWTVFIGHNDPGFELTRQTMYDYTLSEPELIIVMQESVSSTSMLSADTLLAVIPGESSLVTINLQTGVVQHVVDLTDIWVTDKSAIATSPGGRVWITVWGMLYRIDLSTGMATTVGEIAETDVDSLAFFGGKLYATAFNILYEIDPETAQPTVIVENPTGEVWPFFTGLASGGVNLWAMLGSVGYPGPVFRSLRIVDPATGDTSGGAYLPDLTYVDGPFTLDVVQQRANPVPTVSVAGAAVFFIFLALVGFATLRMGRLLD